MSNQYWNGFQWKERRDEDVVVLATSVETVIEVTHVEVRDPDAFIEAMETASSINMPPPLEEVHVPEIKLSKKEAKRAAELKERRARAMSNADMHKSLYAAGCDDDGCPVCAARVALECDSPTDVEGDARCSLGTLGCSVKHG